MKHVSVLLTICLLTVLGAGCNDHLDPQGLQVFDLATKVDGKGYVELEQESAKWIFTSPFDKAPLNDDSVGTLHAPNYQPVKNVTMLHSNFGGVTTRSLTIPGGNYVFFTIIASTYLYFENDPCYPNYQPAPGQSLAEFLKAGADEDFKQVTDLSAKLDGQDIVPDLKQYRVTTPLFKLAFHKDYLDPNCDYTGQQASVLSDGVHLLVKLPKGKHTLTYGSALPAYNFASTITWNLTVE